MMPPSTNRSANHALAVDVRGLARRLGRREALRGITFDVRPGELFAVLGPNGGGKSTLFRILATLLAPSAGDAFLFGASVTARPADVRRRIGLVFQHPALDVRLTALENLLHHGHLHGLHGRALRARAEEALDRLGVRDRSRDRVGTLSGGLARRVEIAKALVHRPSILLLDEPSTGLDPSARRDFLAVLEDIRTRDGVTVVLTTHHLEEADRADRVAILDEGRLVALDPPDRLRGRIGGDVVVFEGADPSALAPRLAERLGVAAAVVDGTVRVEAPRGHELIRDAVLAFPGEIRAASFGRPTLQDVFVRLTGRRLDDGADAVPPGRPS